VLNNTFNDASFFHLDADAFAFRDGDARGFFEEAFVVAFLVDVLLIDFLGLREVDVAFLVAVFLGLGLGLGLEDRVFLVELFLGEDVDLGEAFFVALAGEEVFLVAFLVFLTFLSVVPVGASL